MSLKGLFITFEGMDGCGKSTQLLLAAEALSALGHSVLVTRNPGGMPFGQELRQILLHYPGYVNPISEMLLFMADRAQHMTEVIQPALELGQIVLCDRHLDSTVAYQGYGRGLDLAFIHQLNQTVVQGTPPDLTFLLDGDVQTLRQRVNHRGEADRLESEVETFHEKVRQGYLTQAQHNPHRIVVLDALDSVESTHQKLITTIMAKLPSNQN